MRRAIYMDIQERVLEALEGAWQRHLDGDDSFPEIDEELQQAVEIVYASKSLPAQQMLLALAAGVELEPERDPASLQSQSGVDGVDRRGQGADVARALNRFFRDKELTWKVSQDPGVSNPWREARIDETWLMRRKGSAREWARAFLTFVAVFEAYDRRSEAHVVVDYIAMRVVQQAVEQRIEYPKFGVSPANAMKITKEFLEKCDNPPDGLEAAVTAAVRVVSHCLEHPMIVNRGDINSPDRIDIEVQSENDETNRHGVEVTDSYLTENKLRNEVIEAMRQRGLRHAVVVSRGILTAELDGVSKVVDHARQNLDFHIDLVTVEAIEHWLSFPGYGKPLGGEYLNELGAELDRLSTPSMRRCWLDVLNRYCQRSLRD